MAPTVIAVAVASAGAGMLAGLLLRPLFTRALPRSLAASHRSRASSYGSDADSDWSETDDDIPISDDGEYKMVIVIRNDLKMGKGKIAAQACHAACGSVRKILRTNPTLLRNWECCGQPKIVTKVNDEPSLLALAKRAAELSITTQIIRDAGRTQIAPGSLTAMAVGPAPNHLVDKVTGDLKLL